jgi:hypothetical protein
LFELTFARAALAQDVPPCPSNVFREIAFTRLQAEALSWQDRFNLVRHGDVRTRGQDPDAPGAPADGLNEPLRGWQVEFFAGLGTSAAATGAGNLPPAGPVFPVGSPLAIPPDVAGYSRRVPSWYFGDGAALFNATVGSATKSAITPLDSTLTSPIASWTGSTIGGRIERSVWQWVSAGFQVEYGASRTFVNNVSTQLTSTSNSFESAWQASLNGLPIGSYVASTVATTDSQGRQLFTIGNVIVSAPFRISPYVAVGGGLMSVVGGASKATLSAALSGHYSLSSGEVGTAEIDTVNLTVVPLDTRVPTLSIETGVKALVAGHLGVRADARVYRYRDRSETLLSATPVAATGWSQFLNTTDPLVPLYRFPMPGYSSLGGLNLSNFLTFAADGTATRYEATAGVFWRF